MNLTVSINPHIAFPPDYNIQYKKTYEAIDIRINTYYNIKYDKERNLLYVEWDNQSVQYSDSKLYTWEKSIFVKAKDNYIGGNNVTTNASASGVIINGGIKEFDTPTVNVKVNGTLKCRENVIFYGENITSADYEMSEMFKLNGNIRGRRKMH